MERMKETALEKKVWVHVIMDNLEDMFLEGNQVLDEIKMNMEIYLNKKRAHFPRF